MFVDIAYGIKAKQEDDEFIDVSERALRGLENCNNTGIIDIFPWGKYLCHNAILVIRRRFCYNSCLLVFVV